MEETMPFRFAGRTCRWLALALAALTLAPVRTRAEGAPEAQAVIARYLQAMGLASEGREHSTHAKGTVSAFGLRGTFEQWTERPDKMAAVTTIGPFTLKEGCDASGAWRVDQNGKLAQRDGKDLESARATSWFANEMWLVPGSGGSVAFTGRQKDSTGTYSVLEVTPPVGRSRSLWFSQKTGLLEREVAKDDQRTVITRLSDYQTMGGRLYARRSTVRVEGMPMNDVTADVDSLWVNETIPPSVFAAAAEPVSDMRFRGGPGPARIAFRYESRHVWVRASLNGAPAEDFLVDTGASVSVIDSAYAASHGVKTAGRLQAAGAGAAGAASLATIDSVSVEGEGGASVTASGQKVAVMSLNPFLEPFFWKKTAGVLGYDFISRFVMEVDYDRGVLVLHDPKTFHYEGKGEGLPLTMAGNIPVVKAKLDGRYEGSFRLDVGSGSTVDLHSPFVKAHELRAATGAKLDVTGGGFGGTFSTTVCRMKKMEIGKYSWNDPIVLLSQAETGGLASEDYAGNIGNQILERFRCTFDYERRMVYLEPGRRYGERDVFTRSGVQLARVDDSVVAMQVLPNSPAERAGLRQEDRVVSLDKKPILSFSAEEIRRVFEDGKTGEKHAIEVVRGGKNKKLSLVLAEML
jgi:PDZ domain-containing protein/aspartyl protease